MVQYKYLKKELDDLGFSFKFFGKAEVKELATVLNEGEQIFSCVFGFYEGGSALLVATDSRLLLIDKRLFFVNFEDIRYEMIQKVDFSGGILEAFIRIHTSSKKLQFRSFMDTRLRKLCNYIQDQVTSSRQVNYSVGDGLAYEQLSLRQSVMLPRKRIGKLVYNIVNAPEV